VTSILEILKHFNLHEEAWDGIIIGDGSGTTWQNAAGWSSLLLEKDELRPQLFAGTYTGATNIVAEIMAIKQPMLYIHSNRKLTKNHGYRIIVLSDCQHVVNTINELTIAKVLQMKSNRPLWFGIADMLRTGLSVKACHMPRNSLPAAQFAHDMANVMRKLSVTELKSDLAKHGLECLE
jgi:ribonuclease HI